MHSQRRAACPARGHCVTIRLFRSSHRSCSRLDHPSLSTVMRRRHWLRSIGWADLSTCAESSSWLLLRSLMPARFAPLRPSVAADVDATLRRVAQETANTSFGPDGRVLVCGTNVNPKGNESGTLKFFDVYNADTSAELGERGPWCGTRRTRPMRDGMVVGWGEPVLLWCIEPVRTGDACVLRPVFDGRPRVPRCLSFGSPAEVLFHVCDAGGGEVDTTQA